MTDPISDEERAAWGRLASDATAGPWRSEPDASEDMHAVTVANGTHGVELCAVLLTDDPMDGPRGASSEQAAKDGAFIAMARSAVPQLLAENAALREAAEQERKNYEAAVAGRQDFRLAYREEIVREDTIDIDDDTRERGIRKLIAVLKARSQHRPQVLPTMLFLVKRLDEARAALAGAEAERDAGSAACCRLNRERAAAAEAKLAGLGDPLTMERAILAASNALDEWDDTRPEGEWLADGVKALHTALREAEAKLAAAERALAEARGDICTQKGAIATAVDFGQRDAQRALRAEAQVKAAQEREDEWREDYKREKARVGALLALLQDVSTVGHHVASRESRDAAVAIGAIVIQVDAALAAGPAAPSGWFATCPKCGTPSVIVRPAAAPEEGHE